MCCNITIQLSKLKNIIFLVTCDFCKQHTEYPKCSRSRDPTDHECTSEGPGIALLQHCKPKRTHGTQTPPYVSQRITLSQCVSELKSNMSPSVTSKWSVKWHKKSYFSPFQAKCSRFPESQQFQVSFLRIIQNYIWKSICK